ncbi:unnamed protein product [Echinostoma caproni]|uniref:DNA polymerase zeta catalytic subunit n=1 Tax=Echinostoma caproni TaxID=27848 RepID=A0A183AHB3_9TREM|nr:unnamed protein product [Echinostoma caproni]
MVDSAEFARCCISENTRPSTSVTPLTKELLTQLLQSPLLKQSFQDPRVIQQILQQNYAAQLAENVAGRLSTESSGQLPLQAPRLDCGSTSSLPSYLSMNFPHQQSGEKSASISPNQISNPLYCTEIPLLSREPSITSGDFGRSQLEMISPAEAVHGTSINMSESVERNRTESSSCQTDSGGRSLPLGATANVCEEPDSAYLSPVTSSFISVTEQDQGSQQSIPFQEDKHYLLRPRLRATNRDRFLVRVIRVTYQCSCRVNPSSEQAKVIDPKKTGCHNKECKNKEPRTYVTFQAQLPSISLSLRSSVAGVSLSPATGLRLGFSCSLSSQGPALQDFASPKVAERLDAWEQAGNMPGFRCQVLSALHDTVGMMLQRIRDEGVHAIKLDTDYVFYPPAKELRFDSGSLQDQEHLRNATGEMHFANIGSMLL